MTHPRPGRPSAAALFVALACLVAPARASSQASDALRGPGTAAWEPPVARSQAFELTIRNIMRGPELLGQSPSGVRWTDDSRWIYFRWLPGGHAWDDDRELWRVPAEGGEPVRVSDDEADSVGVFLAGGDLSGDSRWRVTSEDGDLWLVDRREGEARRLTETSEGEGAPIFSADGEAVLFRMGDNLFRLELDATSLRQITDVRTGSAALGPSEAEGQRAFLERQQEELFEHVRRRRERREAAEAEREEREAAEPEPFRVPNGERLAGLTPTRDGEVVLVQTFRSGDDTRRTIVPEWVTESGYTEDIDTRTKVGDVGGGSSRIALYRPLTGDTTWLDLEPEGFEGDVSLSGAEWNDAGSHALIQVRSDDNKDRWLWSVDRSGEPTLLDHLHDDAWIGGPCSSCRGWIPGTDRVWYVSEKTGFAHLYTVNADGTDERALTSGEWELLDVDVPPGQGRFLVSTSEASPFNRHAGWLDFDGGPVDYLTGGEGAWDVTLSPDGERLALVHSQANRPPELYVADADGPAAVEQVTVSPAEDWLSFPWLRPEIVHVPAEDGTLVPARVYRPRDVGAEPNGAGVVFVHGAGYLHNVHDYWSSYEREYMFNHFLAASGYTVLDIDYRGSAGYGRDWRTAIYRWMGGKDLSDQVDGARWLAREEGVDPDRIGLYGGSYGGFITLMALFTAGDTFKSGAALRSVTDWAHYNHGYTSNILNLPHEDEEAYRRSSPIYFAEGFRPDQHLLILHGMVDTNVHFSDVVRLAQRLIELGKENWEMAVYPVENHSFVEPSSWTDEYRRIFELFERTISERGCTEAGGLCAVPEVVAGGEEGEAR